MRKTTFLRNQILISALLLFGIISCTPDLFSQENNSQPKDLRVARSYQRIAVVPLVVNFGSLSNSDISYLKESDIPDRFDAHPINSSLITTDSKRETYAKIEGLKKSQKASKKTSTKLKELLNLDMLTSLNPSTNLVGYNVEIDKSTMIPILQEALLKEKIGNQIISTWFDRTSEGHFSVFGTFQKRAEYNATTLEWLKAQSTIRGISGLTDHADQLVNQTYVLLTDIYKIESVENYYQRIGAPPQDRIDEGYFSFAQIHVLQLDFKDSMQSIFWNDLWLENKDSEEITQSRKAAFDAQDFPFIYKETINVTYKSSQLKNPPKVINGEPLEDKKSMEQLYQESLGGITDLAAFFFLKKTETVSVDLKTNIINAHPIAGRIGEKEGISIDHTYYVMEDREKKNGTIYSKKVGAVRVLTIADNKKEGMVSDSSTFYQIQGKKIYPGMFLKEKAVAIKGINIGLGLERSLKGGMAGPTVRAELNLSQFLSGDLPHGIWLYGAGSFDGSESGRQDIDSSRTFSAKDSEVFITYQSNKGPNQVKYLRFSGGVMFERYFWRNFHYNVNLGVARESMTNLSGLLLNINLRQYLIDSGARIGVSIAPSVQLEAGIHARFAVSSPAFIHKREAQNDEKARLTLPIEGVSYSDIFPGRGMTISSSFALKILL